VKNRRVGAELLHAGGRTDAQTYVTKLIFAFRNFTNAPKSGPEIGLDGTDWIHPTQKGPATGCCEHEMEVLVFR